jgi:hypothetical protein
MIKKLHSTYIVCTCLLFFCAGITRAQTILTPGDIAVLGLNADDLYSNQRWAFMTMRSIAAGTIIHFTDKGYDGSTGEFRLPAGGGENDGFMSWQVQSAIAAGTVIYATNDSINGTNAGVSGALGSSVTNNGFVGQGDQIIVYQGTSGVASSATFIYALNTAQHSVYGASPGVWLTSGSVTLDYHSYLPPGLTNGSTALSLVSNVTATPLGTGTVGSANYGFDNMYYGGTTTGTKAQLLAAIGNPANWAGDNDNGFNLTSGGVIPVSAFVVLPVTLLHFNAEEATAGAVNLTWSTAMEVNNDHFTLERSVDGMHYTVLGTVPGKGDNNQPVNYSFTDQSPEQGSNFYRLTQTDRDGQSKILGTRKVEVAEIALRVGPNPAVHTLDVAFNSSVWREIKLYNSAEQLLQIISPRITTSRLKIGLQNYRPGIYYLAFTGNNGQSTVRRFVKRE